MAAMNWTRSDNGDGPKWISGIYKVVQYAESLSDRLGVHYRAYYKPDGWKNWGNYIDASTPSYPTLKAAQAACAKHLKETHVEAQAR